MLAYLNRKLTVYLNKLAIALYDEFRVELS